jgi:hypothetical protein
MLSASTEEKRVMKSLLASVSFLVLVSISIHAQSILKANDFSFGNESKSRSNVEELYTLANRWILSIARPGDRFLAQQENEQIVFLGSIPLSEVKGTCPISGSHLQFKLTMNFEKGNYRYTFDQLTHSYTIICVGNLAYSISEPLKNSTIKDKHRRKVYQEVELKMENLMSELKGAMSGERK